MDAGNIAAILVAVVAALGAWASQRAASKSALTNTLTSGRIAMEAEAYDRARALDTETIRRQDVEIEELRTKHAVCAREIADMRSSYEHEISALRQRIARLEQGLHKNLEELLRDRLNEVSTELDAE